MLLQIIGNIILVASLVVFNIVCMTKTRTLYVEKKVYDSQESVVEESTISSSIKSIQKEAESELKETTDYYETKTNEHDTTETEETTEKKDIIDLELENAELTQEEEYEIDNFKNAQALEQYAESITETTQETVKETETQTAENKNEEIYSNYATNVINSRQEKVKEVLETDKEYSDTNVRVSIKGNNILLVGDSRAYGISQVVDNIDYIAVKGVFDNELRYYLSLLDESYRDVILISSANNIISDSEHEHKLTQASVDAIGGLVMEARNRVYPGGDLYYYDNVLGDRYKVANDIFKTITSNLEDVSGGRWKILRPSYTIYHSRTSDGLHFANSNEYKLLWQSILEYINK